jgi:hypothetical protein
VPECAWPPRVSVRGTRPILLAAIGAGACPLLKQIGSQFVAGKGPLLVLYSLNLWILHLLKIKADQFHADRRDGAQLAQALDPGLDVEHSAL